jgi:hypothetical protein
MDGERPTGEPFDDEASSGFAETRKGGGYVNIH